MALPVPLSPTQIALAALDQGATSVSFTYNEPLISAEFWIEVAQECHRYGLRIISVTNGYANPVCCKDFFSNMDATNVDLKGFSESFYRKVCKGRLAPVLKNLVVIRELGTCHLEITNLLIPHQNDSTEELRGLSKWVVANLGVDTPVHFSAFHPDFRAMDWNQATSRDVDRARAIAQEEGLHYVYTGNVPKSRGSDTFCPSCGELLIERGGFGVLESHLRQGKCPFCGLAVPGTFQVA
jgi:pyruvate formate lyase activating enzyme